MRDFPIKPSVAKALNENEKAIIKQYGYWLQAIEKNTITPFTKAQKDFQLVCSKGLKPRTEFEIVWLKFKKAIFEDQMKSRDENLINFRELEKKSKNTKLILEVQHRQKQLTQERLEQLNEYITTNWIDKSNTYKPKSYTTCPVCSGDGGVNGGCFKCDGTGWV